MRVSAFPVLLAFSPLSAAVSLFCLRCDLESPRLMLFSVTTASSLSLSVCRTESCSVPPLTTTTQTIFSLSGHCCLCLLCLSPCLRLSVPVYPSLSLRLFLRSSRLMWCIDTLFSSQLLCFRLSLAWSGSEEPLILWNAAVTQL